MARKKKCGWCDDNVQDHISHQIFDAGVFGNLISDVFINEEDSILNSMAYFNDISSENLIFCHTIEINYCPFCGRKLRDYNKKEEE